MSDCFLDAKKYGQELYTLLQRRTAKSEVTRLNSSTKQTHVEIQEAVEHISGLYRWKIIENNCLLQVYKGNTKKKRKFTKKKHNVVYW